MSSTLCLIPIIAALFTAETRFNLTDKWYPSTDTQTTFLNEYYLPHKDHFNNLFSAKELQALISPDVNEINTFLEKNNFDLRLNEQQTDNPSMYLAAIMNILAKWTSKGSESSLTYNNTQYPSVTMNKNSNRFDCFTVEEHPEPIIALETQSDDMVYITIADQKRSGFDLLSHIMALSTDSKINHIHADQNQSASFFSTVTNFIGGYLDEPYTHIEFPMIDLNQEPNIDWLEGLGNTGWTVFKALQQTKFQLNEEGTAAQSAVVILTEGCGFRSKQEQKIKKLIIDKPFFLWIKRKGLDLPIFAAYFDTDVWKRPNKLG